VCVQDRTDFFTTTVEKSKSSLLKTARRYSACEEDARDAYQQTLEIFIRRFDTVCKETAASWLHTVVKHEAIATRRRCRRWDLCSDFDTLSFQDRTEECIEERVIEQEVASQVKEALNSLKLQERKALLLQGQGYSYRQICTETGWSYTKTNRCLTEGRRALRSHVAKFSEGSKV